MLQYYEEKTSQKHLVLWDGEMTSCSCKNFEFWSIFCRHPLSVLIYKDCYWIPSLYLPPRWCCETSLGGKELIVLNDENLVDKEDLVDTNVNDAINGIVLFIVLRSQRWKVAQSKKEWKVEKNRESKRELVGFVSMLVKISLHVWKGEGKLNFLKWCKENEKLYFNRYRIEVQSRS